MPCLWSIARPGCQRRGQYLEGRPAADVHRCRVKDSPQVNCELLLVGWGTPEPIRLGTSHKTSPAFKKEEIRPHSLLVIPAGRGSFFILWYVHIGRYAFIVDTLVGCTLYCIKTPLKPVLKRTGLSSIIY